MVWEFKQQLFISQRRVSPQAVADLSSPAIRAQLQAHIDASENLPPRDAPDEYAALFEAVYPAEVDRRAYLNAKVAGAKPSYGHLALATLIRAQLTRLVWTTNVDPLVADACAKVYDATGPLTTVALDGTDLAAQCIGEARWPVEVKLHGDFRSRRLKNTSDELRHQDVRLRQILVDSCRRFGLVVAGYSGRDDSVIGALEEALERTGAFPAGLFWLHRGEEPPLPRVIQLLTHAVVAGAEAALVMVDNFDEALRDLVRLVKGPANPQDISWAPLLRLVGALSGIMTGHPELRWREGVRTRLDWADDRLWLLFEPLTVFDGITDDNKGAAADFARERTVKRYNRQLNELIAFWAVLLAGDGGDLRALGVGDGVDATFRLSADTGFSRRAQSL